MTNRPNDMKTYTALDDPCDLGSSDMDSKNILLGTYSVAEWMIATTKRKKIETGQNMIAWKDNWISPTLHLRDWITSIGKLRFSFDDVNEVMVFNDYNLPEHDCDGIATISIKNGKIDAALFGSELWINTWVARLDAVAKKAGPMIQWVYGKHGEEMNLPLSYRPLIKSAYPWLDRDPEKYIDDYLNSDAGVLILLGPPGTGKTTFIKNLIHRSGLNAKVTYDEQTMSNDSFFASFMEDEAGFLIMEDADAFLARRTDGNTMMHRFLNVSDGLISAPNKKLVFSTNLDSVKDIDEALTRPGRCFDVAQARPLTRSEAEKVIQEIGRGSVPNKDKISLAEIFSQQPSGGKKNRTMGFV